MDFRYPTFRALSAVSELRSPGNALCIHQEGARPANNWLWVYCTSFGELQALSRLIPRYLSDRGYGLLLLSNHPHYAESYLQKFPDAAFASCDGQHPCVQTLVRAFPIAELWIGEVPCMLGDAPCRFPYSYLHAAKKAGARVSVINGWLYGERPVARLDLLEQRMLGRAYVNAIDLCFAQTDGVAQTLLGAGMSEDRLHVTGSLKFDQMAPAHGAPPKSGAWWEALRSKSRAPDGGPTIVAGCVTEPEEQRFVLDAFSKVRANRPDAQLVMVPRHPEKPDRMQALECLLGEYQLPFAFRTKWQQTPVENFAVLVLDTIGELKHFYEVGDFVYIGKDHNVLEPLAYAKPVHVSGSWQRRYPSYPIYTQCLDGGLIASVTNSDALADAWSGIPEPVPADQLDGQRGATAYVLERLLNDAGKAA